MIKEISLKTSRWDKPHVKILQSVENINFSKQHILNFAPFIFLDYHQLVYKTQQEL